MGKITLAAKSENLPRFLEYIKEEARRAGFSDKGVHDIQLAAEEAVVNVINYAYPAGKGGDIELSCALKEGALEIQIADSGIPFNPLERAEPDINAPLAERGIGGLGIYMFRRLMDTVAYRREDDRNILTLLKRPH